MSYLKPVFVLALAVFMVFAMYKYVPVLVKPHGPIANLIDSLISSR